MNSTNTEKDRPEKGTILQNFRDFYIAHGCTPDAAVDFISAQEDELAPIESGEKPVGADLKKQITEFYEYFAGHYGDDAAVMDKIEGKWQAKPPAILLLGFKYAVEEEEVRLAAKYDRIGRDSREDYNISVLEQFIVSSPCRIDIIGSPDNSYRFDWPMEMASDDVTDIQVLKGMLSDFILAGDGMIVRKYASGNDKDEVYGFVPDNGSVRCMDTASLEFAMGRNADQTMKTYLDNVVIKDAGLSFR